MSRLTPDEFSDYTEEVLQMGATKYGPHSWKHGKHFNHVDNCVSIIGHTLSALGFPGDVVKALKANLKEHVMSNNAVDTEMLFTDAESGLLHLQHVGTRGLMGTLMLKEKQK